METLDAKQTLDARKLALGRLVSESPNFRLANFSADLAFGSSSEALNDLEIQLISVSSNERMNIKAITN